jgi:hypothetical protein
MSELKHVRALTKRVVHHLRWVLKNEMYDRTFLVSVLTGFSSGMLYAHHLRRVSEKAGEIVSRPRLLA